MLGLEGHLECILIEVSNREVAWSNLCIFKISLCGGWIDGARAEVENVVEMVAVPWSY